LRGAQEWANDCAHEQRTPFHPAADAPPELNPRLDRAALAREFARAGRIHIPSVLTEPSALRLYQVLQQETPWTLTLNKGSDFLDIEKPSPEERTRLAIGAFERGAFRVSIFFRQSSSVGATASPI